MRYLSHLYHALKYYELLNAVNVTHFFLRNQKDAIFLSKNRKCPLLCIEGQAWRKNKVYYK